MRQHYLQPVTSRSHLTVIKPGKGEKEEIRIPWLMTGDKSPSFTITCSLSPSHELTLSLSLSNSKVLHTPHAKANGIWPHLPSSLYWKEKIYNLQSIKCINSAIRAHQLWVSGLTLGETPIKHLFSEGGNLTRWNIGSSGMLFLHSLSICIVYTIKEYILFPYGFDTRACQRWFQCHWEIFTSRFDGKGILYVGHTTM